MTAASLSSPRSELGHFLRTRRARLRPSDVGLPEGARRRTPGLRREEVAQLADVGVSWYTWLEQGRDIHVSEPLLERLAQALRLTPTERAHLFALAQGRPAASPLIAPAGVSEALQRVLDVHPFPALVATMRWDYLAWNTAAVRLYGDFSKLTPALRNGLWRLFTDPDRRRMIPAWEQNARASVQRFRLDAARSADRSAFDELAAALSRVSPEFARWWGDHDVVEVGEGSKELIHSDVGLVRFDYVTLTQAEPDGRVLRVTFYSPQAGESEERTRRLFGPITR
ncbi:helix-turn-helix transcriptional regulator [Cystobacter fuscus]